MKKTQKPLKALRWESPPAVLLEVPWAYWRELALAIPGVGPFISAGPIMAGLAGLGVGGALGGVVGALVGMGIPEYEAKRHEGRVKDGGTLLSVHCDTSDEVSKAKDLLKSTGANDISSSGETSDL